MNDHKGHCYNSRITPGPNSRLLEEPSCWHPSHSRPFRQICTGKGN